MATFPAIVYLRRALHKARADEQAIEASIRAIEEMAPGTRARFRPEGWKDPLLELPDAEVAPVEWFDGCYNSVLFVVSPAEPTRVHSLETWVGEVTTQLMKRLRGRLDWPPTHRKLLSSARDTAKVARKVWGAMSDFVGGPPEPPPARLFEVEDPEMRAMLERWEQESGQLRRLLDGEHDDEGGTAVGSPRLPKPPPPTLESSQSWPES